ncbi:sulfurtransferase [Alteromonas sp. H39]|uniref:sulfurtransferase n=1 Tax=Alteromonas sp. H39 TaxID=3389876 RepID=UPI0039DFC390
MTTPLINVSELRQALTSKPVALLRVLMDDPVSGEPDKRDGGAIPNSRDFDLDGDGSDHEASLPHTLPSVSTLSHYLGQLGIADSTAIIVYDTRGIYCAPRAWWVLKSLGHVHAQILNGGSPAWEAAGHALNPEPPFADQTRLYEPNPQRHWFVDADDVLRALNTDIQILDARSHARFEGREPEPRDGVRSGHMPGAKSLHYARLLTDGEFKPVSELQAEFDKAGINLTNPIICTCGSGITACIIGVAALMCGAANVSVYDGSWSEWGADLRYPVEVTS